MQESPRDIKARLCTIPVYEWVSFIVEGPYIVSQFTDRSAVIFLLVPNGVCNGRMSLRYPRSSSSIPTAIEPITGQSAEQDYLRWRSRNTSAKKILKTQKALRVPAGHHQLGRDQLPLHNRSRVFHQAKAVVAASDAISAFNQSLSFVPRAFSKVNRDWLEIS